MSEGMERFIVEFLPKIRANNPQVKYSLHRTYVLCDPFLVGVYDWDRTRKFRCSWKHASQILAMAEEMSLGGDFRPGKYRRVSTELPRGQQLWTSETRGHDVYAVYSKYKDDPPNPKKMTSQTHPHLTYRLMYSKAK